jgi:D-sedoheptulose 7-phosphate isomerase
MIVSEFAEKYYKTLKSLICQIEATGSTGKKIDFCEAIGKTANLLFPLRKNGHKIMLIGNGASATISSHIATDFWKNGNIRAVAFNDTALLTCVSNDYGYKYVFEKPIAMFGEKGDVLFAISSSGKSDNILCGVKMAEEKGIKIITFSGFKPDNPLRKKGQINFYVPYNDYGPVETLHLSICHCLVDMVINNAL